jgi:hypothetical protein
MIQEIIEKLGLKGDIFYVNGRYFVVMKRGIAEIRMDKRDISVIINIDGEKKILTFRERVRLKQ